MNRPLVSIIMPARDVESYIDTAIDSVLKQEYVNWELIVVENASLDKTAERVKAQLDSRIKLIHTDAPGLSNARNLGLEYAKGDFICFLDADDKLPVYSLSSRIKKFEENPSAQFVDGGMEQYDYSFAKLHHRWFPTFRGKPYREMMLLLPGCFCGITWMVKRKEGMELKFDTSWTHLEDRVFFLSIANKGEYDFVDEVIYHIRRRPGSLMTDLSLLEKAYSRYISMVHDMGILDPPTQLNERRSFHRMFFRTHLKHGSIWSALKHLYWRFTIK